MKFLRTVKERKAWVMPIALVVFLACAGALIYAVWVFPMNPFTKSGMTGGGGTLRVFGAFVTPIEEPWDGRIHEALLRAEEAGRIEYKFVDAIGYEGALETELRAAAEGGYNIIFGDAFGQEELVRKVAKDYPDMAFVFGSGGGPMEPNLSVFDNWLQEPGYLAGMTAGGMSKTKIISVVAGHPVPEVNRIVNAFIAGVHETCPECTVLTTFINSWFDPAKAQETAQAHVDAGADVIFAERFGGIAIAKENGLWAIGMMSDQRELCPDCVLTSLVWHMDSVVNRVIDEVKGGSYAATDYHPFINLASGGAELAPLLEGVMPAGLVKLVREREGQIRDGTFRVDIVEVPPPAVSGPVSQ